MQLLLARGGLTHGAIAASVQLPKPSASYHLGALLAQSALTSERSGREKWYRLADPRHAARVMEGFEPLPDDPDAFTAMPRRDIQAPRRVAPPVERFRVRRDLRVGAHPLLQLADGLEDARGLKAMFPDAEERHAFLASVEVFVSPFHGFMWVDDTKGRVVVSADYLKEGEARSIFLDLVHELVHIRQHREGRDLWDERFAYVDRPTEVEAYQVAVEEAKELGLSEEEIREYLHVPWTTAEEHARLCATVGVPFPKAPKR